VSDIDWNVELRKIVREYDGLPPEPSPAALRAQQEAAQRARQRAATRLALIGAWARIVLVAALVAALYWWPLTRGCGLDLAALLGAVTMVVIGGLWIAAFTWRHRLAASHGVGVALFIAGLALAAAQVLPRAGYATVAGVHGERGWRCGGGER
jgi:hypothetical protein